MMLRTQSLFTQLHAHDLAICARFNRICHYHWLTQFLRLISWLGNGKFWYVLIVLLPFLFGRDKLVVSLAMMASGMVALAIYSLIKSQTSRPRPYTRDQRIAVGIAPLDQYSFPSGHTLHAVNFTVIALHYCPELAPLIVPFTVLTGLGRIALGLHYPTDVVIGAALGALLGNLTLLIMTTALVV